VRYLTIKLEAGIERLYGISGNFIRLMSSATNIAVVFDGAGIESVLIPGIGFKIAPFTGVRFLSDTAQTIVIYVGEGEVEDNRKTLQQSGASNAGYGPVNIGVAATLIADLNSDRRSLLVQAVGGDIYVGYDATVTAATGFPVKKDASFKSEFTGTVYGIAAVATDARFVEESN
jgi:hypothetical protein